MCYIVWYTCTYAFTYAGPLERYMFVIFRNHFLYFIVVYFFSWGWYWAISPWKSISHRHFCGRRFAHFSPIELETTLETAGNNKIKQVNNHNNTMKNRGSITSSTWDIRQRPASSDTPPATRERALGSLCPAPPRNGILVCPLLSLFFILGLDSGPTLWF